MRSPAVGVTRTRSFHRLRAGLREQEIYIVNVIIWLVVGGVVGWVASKIMRTDAQQGLLLNVVVGIVGAFLAGWLISPMVGEGTINSGDFSLGGLVVSLLGAVLLLAIVNLFRRGGVR